MSAWKLQTSENFLKALLNNNMDSVAKDFCLFYIKDATIDLFIYCIKNENEVFLKHALRNSVFPGTMLADSEIINEILNTFQLGVKTELLLNILIFCDF